MNRTRAAAEVPRVGSGPPVGGQRMAAVILWGEPLWRGGRGKLISLVFVLTSCRVMVNVIEGGGRAWCGAIPKAIFGRTCFCELAAPRPARPWPVLTGSVSTPNRCCRTPVVAQSIIAAPRRSIRRLPVSITRACCLQETNNSLLGLRLAVEMDLRVARLSFLLCPPHRRRSRKRSITWYDTRQRQAEVLLADCGRSNGEIV